MIKCFQAFYNNEINDIVNKDSSRQTHKYHTQTHTCNTNTLTDFKSTRYSETTPDCVETPINWFFGVKPRLQREVQGTFTTLWHFIGSQLHILCVCVCVCPSVYACVCVVLVARDSKSESGILSHMHTCTHARTHIHTHTHTYAHTYTFKESCMPA